MFYLKKKILCEEFEIKKKEVYHTVSCIWLGNEHIVIYDFR